MSSNIDLQLLLDFNSLIPANSLSAKAFSFPGNNELIRGFPVFFPLVALWFSTNCQKRRGRMLVGLLAVCLATGISVWLQAHFTFHLRPSLDPAIHLRGTDLVPTSGFDRPGSFPSDTATLFFSLATVIFLEHRMAGAGAFVWSLFTVGFLRIAMGWHYPSDVLGAIVLGTASVYLLTRVQYLKVFFERVLERCEPRIYIVHALLFLFLADAYALFPGLQGFIRGFKMITVALVRR